MIDRERAAGSVGDRIRPGVADGLGPGGLRDAERVRIAHHHHRVVVGSRIGGIPEYLDDGQTGLLFAPDNHEEMARAVRFLLDDRAKCREMGRRAREWAVGQFSLDARLNDFLDLYRV